MSDTDKFDELLRERILLGIEMALRTFPVEEIEAQMDSEDIGGEVESKAGDDPSPWMSEKIAGAISALFENYRIDDLAGNLVDRRLPSR